MAATTNPIPDPNSYRRRCSDPSARIQKFIHYMETPQKRLHRVTYIRNQSQGFAGSGGPKRQSKSTIYGVKHGLGWSIIRTTIVW